MAIEHGEECPHCLRWFCRVLPDDSCLLCESRGTPRYPNRLQYFAILAGLSLREVARRSNVAWSGLVEISNGRRSPHRSTQKRIVEALGLDASDPRDFRRVFPTPRKRNRPRTVKKPDLTPEICPEARGTPVGPARGRIVTPPSPPVRGAGRPLVQSRTPGLGHLQKVRPDTVEFGRPMRPDPRGTAVTRRSVRRR